LVKKDRFVAAFPRLALLAFRYPTLLSYWQGALAEMPRDKDPTIADFLDAIRAIFERRFGRLLEICDERLLKIVRETDKPWVVVDLTEFSQRVAGPSIPDVLSEFRIKYPGGKPLVYYNVRQS
jgi:hypothetical protein